MDGFEDDRGMLFFEIVDILEEHQPQAFLLENVKNLRFINEGEAFATIKSKLAEAGYIVYDEALNALNFGLPQHRERLIIVGLREDVAERNGEFTIPTKSENRLGTEEEQRSALANILEDDPDEKYYASEKIRQDRRNSVDNPDCVPEPAIWHENRNGRITPHPHSVALRAGASWNYILVNGERHPTARELLRLQGFPEWFVLSDDNQSLARRLVGNTVPVPVVRAVGVDVLDVLEIPRSQGTPNAVEETARGD